MEKGEKNEVEENRQADGDEEKIFKKQGVRSAFLHDTAEKMQSIRETQMYGDHVYIHIYMNLFTL